MTRMLNLADIQGNIISGYGRQGYPHARYVFLHVSQKEAGRDFINMLMPNITTALPWESSGKKAYPNAHPDEVLKKKPPIAYNLAFTYRGLEALGLPTETLRAMPTEFIDGMAARGHILGDQPERKQDEIQPPVPAHWDTIWQDSQGNNRVHILLSLNLEKDTSLAELDAAFQAVEDFCAKSGGGIAVLPGHGPEKLRYQDVNVLMRPGANGVEAASRQEHFGFADGYGDPVFKGQDPPETAAQAAIGGGKLLPNQSWAALATGEFLLGYPDEAQEIPGQFYPFSFTRNGTFMAYRKLHQNVASFKNYIAATAQTYANVMGLPATPAGLEESRQTVMAKMGGRWQNGVPLTIAPTYAKSQAIDAHGRAVFAGSDEAAKEKMRQAYVDFTYQDDPGGTKCPMTAHMRRTNPRDGLDPKGSAPDPKDRTGSALNNRRRILRRGLPYGTSDAASTDADEHGIIFLAVCANLSRQFEFIQQQWIQYGLDFNAGNDTCPLLGNHDEKAKFVIPADPGSGKPPFVCARLPQLVEVRGGDYFFIPSITGLRMLGMGIVDPT